jgi:hypothetical protein
VSQLQAESSATDRLTGATESSGGAGSQATIPLICVFSPNPYTWQWFAADTVGRARWIFYTEDPKTPLERLVRRPKLSRIAAAFRCVRGAAQNHAAAIAAHSSLNTFWASFALRLLNAKIPLLSFSFHFAGLPTGPRLWLMKRAFSRVARFTVHSEPERERYSRHFDIPIDRFDLVRWGVAPSSAASISEAPIVTGTYICALGKDGRDYRTLIRAMEQLPDLTLAVVAQPENVTGVALPSNVKLFCDIAWDDAMNILHHSQFMALPLETGETSCGHITLVQAMFRRKAIVATSSSGIADYFPPNYDSPRVAAGDVNGWVEALRVMSNDAARRERCVAAAEPFAHAYCSHDSALNGVLHAFSKSGIRIG